MANNKNTQGNNTESNNNINDYMNDIQDLKLLTTQSYAQLILILGYYLDYISSQQAIELIYLKHMRGNLNFSQSSEENYEQSNNIWANEALNADKTALMAAKLELFGQTILTRIDYIKFQRFSENISNDYFALTRTANEEIYLGAVFGEIGFILNLQGVQLLYSLSNENPVLDE